MALQGKSKKKHLVKILQKVVHGEGLEIEFLQLAATAGLFSKQQRQMNLKKQGWRMKKL